MNLLNASEIDFSAFGREYPENANVIPAWAYADSVIDKFYGDHANKGLLLPWSKTHHQISLRPGEVSVWAGINGSGKSLLLNQIMLQAIRHGQSCVIASMEMTPTATLERMSRQAVGVRFPTEQAIRSFLDWTDGKLWMYIQQGMVSSKRMIEVLRYCDKALAYRGEKIHVKHFVVDSLMKCGISADDYNRQKSFVDELCTIARDTGIHIHLVAHERKGESSRKIGDKFSVKGASEIIDQVDNAFILWRNKDKEEESQMPYPDAEVMNEPDAVLRMDKQRHFDYEGKTTLWYHRDSMQYVGHSSARPIEFMDNESELERQAIRAM